MLVCNLWSSLGEIENCVSYMDGKKIPKKKAEHSRLVGGSFNKHGNLFTRFVLSNYQMSRSPHLPTRTPVVYTKALTDFCHLFSLYDLINTLLSQGSIFETASSVQMGKTYIPRTGEGMRGLSNCLGPAQG